MSVFFYLMTVVPYNGEILYKIGIGQSCYCTRTKGTMDRKGIVQSFKTVKGLLFVYFQGSLLNAFIIALVAQNLYQQALYIILQASIKYITPYCMKLPSFTSEVLKGIFFDRACLLKQIQLLSQMVMNIRVLELFIKGSKNFSPISLQLNLFQ